MDSILPAGGRESSRPNRPENIPDSPALRRETALDDAYLPSINKASEEAMKKILIGTALAGMIVGTFASLSFAAPLPAKLDNGSSAIMQVDLRCGPHHHMIGGHRDRFGHWMRARCVRNDDRVRDYYRHDYYR